MSTFKDSKDREWKIPRVTANILIKVCRKLNLKLADLTGVNLEIADVIEILPIICRDQIKERALTEADFYDALEIPHLKAAMELMMKQLQSAFPDSEDSGEAAGGDEEGPFDPGK